MVRSTDTCSNDIERTANMISSKTIRRVGEKDVLENGHKSDKAIRTQHAGGNSTRTTITQHIASGTLRNDTDLKIRSKATKTTNNLTYTVVDGGLDNRREILSAHGIADDSAVKSGGCITKKVVQSDGTAVTTTTSSKTSSVKYVVEANTTHEKVTR